MHEKVFMHKCIITMFAFMCLFQDIFKLFLYIKRKVKLKKNKINYEKEV